MKSSKILILVFTLSFPVILYLFLTYYGSNEFDLPIFFETENEFCDRFQTLDNISDTLTNSENKSYLLKDILKGNINIVHFPDLSKDNQQLQNELSRLLVTFSSHENIKLHAFYQKQLGLQTTNYLMNSDGVNNYKVNNAFYHNLIDCYITLPTQRLADEHPAEVVLNEHSTLVLIDQNAKIRGYYDGLETKDVDRLILEIRILMTK